MARRFVALSAVSVAALVTLSAVAREPRPFAPLPLDSQLAFRNRVTLFAGHSIHRLATANGVDCELRLAVALPKDLVLGPETPLTVVAGGVQRLRWNSGDKSVTHFRVNELGEAESIPQYSAVADVVRRIRFAASMAAYGGRPHEIARVYGIGGLLLRRPDSDMSIALLCSKGQYASGGTFPGLPTLDEASALVDVKLGD